MRSTVSNECDKVLSLDSDIDEFMPFPFSGDGFLLFSQHPNNLISQHFSGAPAPCSLAGIRNVAPHRKTNTATAPIHSQKPRCQKTECRNACRIGRERVRSNFESNNNASLQTIPASGNTVTVAQIQNNDRGRVRPHPFHAHQQLTSILSAINPAEDRARNS